MDHAGLSNEPRPSACKTCTQSVELSLPYTYFCGFFFFFSFLGHTWECSGPIPDFFREPYGLLGIDYGQGKCSTRYTSLGQYSFNILGFFNGVKELELPEVKMV